MNLAVLTLTRDRTGHLVNLVRGLVRGRPHPDVLVVAVMGGDDPRRFLPQVPFDVEWVYLETDEDEPLPLAEARNRAAGAVDTRDLVFLDVDCIPGPDLVGRYHDGLRQLDGLLMGGVRYLPPGWPAGPDWRWEQLLSVSDRHPVRPDPPQTGMRRTDRYEMFWSLTFAVTRATFGRLGGFDTSFAGYGGEDTDLAFTARRLGVPAAWVDAWCLHQHHDTYDPPLQHLADIVVNARRFHDKWGTWPMEGWLHRFDELGIVRWSQDGEDLQLIRRPTQAELDEAHRSTAVPSG